MQESRADLFWSDSHCHLNLPEFDADLPLVLERAEAAGVKRILVPGIDLETSELAMKMAEDNETIFFACGIHPNSSTDFSPQQIDRLRKLAAHPKCAAIGEIGLDTYREYCPLEKQIESLELQLALAAEMSLPVLLHCRRAFEQLYPLIRAAIERTNGELSGIFHAFDESTEELRQVLETGFLIGLGGAITYKSRRRAAVVREVPLERILLETDAPYLTPIPYRGKRNEPGYIPFIGAQVAGLKRCAPEDVQRSVHENMVRLFPALLG